MVDSRIARLIERLHDKTRQGELDWRETPDLGEFSASFPKYSVVVSWSDRGKCWLKIYGPEGKFLEAVSDEQLRSGYEESAAHFLEELFDLARRKALDVDGAIDELLATVG